jgi:hypothetical protein
MFICTFLLNREQISFIEGPGFKFPAYSGYPEYRNDPDKTHITSRGPIPVGNYAIVDRESSSWIRDAIKSATRLNIRFNWFALYALDNKVDDETFVNGVRRGEFRLHPGGVSGVSEGCVTLENTSDFNALRSRILAQKCAIHIPGSAPFQAYGVLRVLQVWRDTKKGGHPAILGTPLTLFNQNRGK